MNYRNAKRLANGWIGCEIEHPVHGWIPFACDPNDTGAMFDVAALYAQMDADPATAPYTGPTAEEIAAARMLMSLSFAQLLIGLVAEGWITQAEGVAWLAGTPPAAVNALIDQLPAEQQFPALARAVRPSVVLRTDQLVVDMGQAAGKTPEEIDDFFQTYSNV